MELHESLTNNTISIKLDENNFLIWKQQVYLTVKGYGLEGYLEGTRSVPPEYLENQHGERTENPERLIYDQQDSALASWLLSLMSPDVIPDLVRCHTSSSIWDAIHKRFSDRSWTRIIRLRRSLHTQKKRDQSMIGYLGQIKMICGNLNLCGEKVSDSEQIAAILNGLSPEYDIIAAIVTSSKQPYDVDAVVSILVDMEDRRKWTMFSNPIGANPAVQPATNRYNNGSKQQVTYIQPWMTNQYAQPRSFSQYRPQCQLCGKVGHEAQRCCYRFDPSFKGDIHFKCG